MSVDRLDVEAASDRITDRVRRTPMMRVQVGDSRVFLKLELLQHTGSFKPRGAFNRTLGADSIPTAGLIAASGGNHGLAVAHVARELGLHAEIFVPRVSPAVKVDAIARLGAHVTVAGALYHDALAAAELRKAETGALSIHAYDNELTVAGQGTMAKEITEQLADVSEVVIAVGGGGFAAGAVAWLGSSARVVAVEPSGSAALHHALVAGGPVDVEIDSVASDSLGARSIGPIPWSVLSRHAPTSVLVHDDSIRAAQLWLWRELKLVVEPGGATAFAAVLDGSHHVRADGSTVVVVCGANTDPSQFSGGGLTT